MSHAGSGALQRGLYGRFEEVFSCARRIAADIAALIP